MILPYHVILREPISHTVRVSFRLLVMFKTSTLLNFTTIAWIEEYDPANRAISDRKAMPIFLNRIHLNTPRPRSHLCTLSTIAGVKRPSVERKMAPQRLMNSSKSGKATASATVIKENNFE